ncbi:hypothetical protein MMC09_004932 [Bachmanniomyces sp. S44760]|nr:hypothetical protein [Bachmanniomyces sp. S44760]
MTTATRSPKRQRTNSSNDPYELLYWPGIPGRGEFVRLAFEATKTPYTDISNATKDGIRSLIPLVKPTPGTEDFLADDESNVPPLAPPILKHGSLLLSQTSNILLYLGPRLGLVPSPIANPEGLYRVNELALTALDGLSNEPHEAHHPVSTSAYYEDQKSEALRRAQDYRTNRLPKFLAHFERVLGSKSSGGGGEWLYAGRMTYADLVLFQALDGVSHAFPNAVRGLRDSGDYDKVWALYERVKGLENVKAYLGSDRRMKYGSGIWRYYPELDE